jgi:hypothetical protein
MCPITQEYIKNEYYIGNSSIPVKINGALEKDIKEKASKVLALQRKGAKIIFADVLSIEEKLIKLQQIKNN